MKAAANAGFVLAALCNCDGLRLFIGLFELLLAEWLLRFDIEDDDDEDEQDDDNEVGDEVDDEETDDDDDALFAIKCVFTLGELGECSLFNEACCAVLACCNKLA